MICEKCGKEHNGNYGSGRFCSLKCSKSFSTSLNRQEISAKLSGKVKTGGKNFSSEADNRRRKYSKEDREKSRVAFAEKKYNEYLNTSFDDLSLKLKKRRVIEEQGGVCLWCGNNHWLSQTLVLELDHIDGNNTNHNRNNLRALCPNCHSLTPTFRKSRKSKVTNQQIVEALSIYPNDRQVLINLNLTPKGANYERLRNLKDPI